MSSTNIQSLIDIIYEENISSLETLKELLKINDEEQLIHFLLDQLKVKLEAFTLGSKGLNAWAANINKLFDYVNMCLKENKYESVLEINETLNYIEKTLNQYTYEDNIIRKLEFMNEKCQQCKDLLYFSKSEDTSFTKETNDSAALIYNDNYKNCNIDLSSKYTISIDSDDTRIIDDAISIEKLSDGRILVCVYISNVGNDLSIGSREDKRALTKNLRDQSPMLQSDIIISHSLNSNKDRNVIACSFIVDKTLDFIEEDSIRFFKAKVKVNKRLYFTDITGILDNTIYCDPRLKEIIEILNQISISLYNKRVTYNKLMDEEYDTKFEMYKYLGSKILKPEAIKNAGSRIVCELMTLVGDLAVNYANQKNYPFLRFVSVEDVSLNPKLFPNLNIDGNIPTKDLTNDKYYFSDINNVYGDIISKIGKARISSPLWRYPDLANQRLINQCFLGTPTDKIMYALEENIKNTAKLFNEKQLNEIKELLNIEERRKQKEAKIKEEKQKKENEKEKKKRKRY